MNRSAHVVLVALVGQIELRCLHCETESNILLPMPVRDLLRRAERFVAKHRRCKAVVEREAKPGQ